MKTKLTILILSTISFLNAQSPNWAWAKTAGSSAIWDYSGGSDYHSSTIVTDALGNSYVTGHFTGTAQFGTISLSSPSFPSVFTAKYDSSGNCMWAKHFGAHVPAPPAPFQMANNGKAIGIDSLGNCYVSGVFNGSPTDTIHFGNSILLGYDDARSEIFLVKYDANGNEVWATQSKYLNGSGVNASTSISVDKAGNSYLAFYLSKDNLVSFGNLPQIIGHGSYLVKHNSFGAALWTTQLGISAGPPTGVFAYAVASDKYGRAYVTGMLSGTATVAGTPPSTLTAIGTLNQQWDTYLAKLNANGSLAWVKQFGHPQGTSFGTSIGTDSLGHVYLQGNFTSSIVIGSATLSNLNASATKYNTYITKMDSVGNVIWNHQPGLSETDAACMRVTEAGNIYFAVSYAQESQAVNYCNATYGPGTAGIMVGKLDANGSCVWNRAAQGSMRPGGLGLDGEEDIYLAGSIQGSASFAGHQAVSAGGQDVLLAKITTLFTSTVNVGLTESEKQNVILVYPNPFESEIHFILPEFSSQSEAELVITSILGEELHRQKVDSKSQVIFPRAGLPNGMYFYRIHAGEMTLGEAKLIAR